LLARSKGAFEGIFGLRLPLLPVEVAAKSNTPVDIKRDNVRLDQERILVLVDPAMPNGKNDVFLLMRKKHPESFAVEGSDDISI
jgi:hypothetical protein